MRSTRRVVLLALVCLFCQFTGTGWAQSFPSKVIRVVEPGTTGGGGDILVRLVTNGLTQELGQQVIVDNRGGAAGIIGAEIASKAPPDGYTLIIANVAHAAFVTLYKNLPYDLLRDFAAITQVAASPHVVVVPAASPIKSFKELVETAKAKPGSINYGSLGAGSSTFLATELFKAQAGVNLVNVAYKGGGPAVTGIVAGEVNVYFSPLASSLPHIRQGRLRALAVTTPKRVSLIPEVPAIAESGYPNYAFKQWYGFLAPAKTPKEVIAKIRNATAAVLNKPEVKNRLIELGYIPVGDQPEEFAAYMKSEVENLGTLIRNLNLTTEMPTK